MTGPHPGPGGAEEEALRRQLEEELRRIRVEDVLAQTAVTLVNLTARRLGLTGAPEERDLGQAKLGIDGVRALLPLLPADAQAPVRDAISQLQLAFAREARGGEPGPGEGAGAPGGGAEGGGERAGAGAADEEAERAKARAKIWTPPGTA